MTGKLIPPRIPLVDARTGGVAREWYLWFLSLAGDANAGFDPDQFAAMPLSEPSLAARVAELEQAVDDLRKGTVVL
jgi:hypothetical protein